MRFVWVTLALAGAGFGCKKEQPAEDRTAPPASLQAAPAQKGLPPAASAEEEEDDGEPMDDVDEAEEASVSASDKSGVADPEEDDSEGLGADDE